MGKDGRVPMLAAELEYCVLSILVGGADPLPLLQLSACAGAISDPPILTDDTYDKLYSRSRGKKPSSMRTGPIFAARNRLPPINTWRRAYDNDIYAELDGTDFYPDYVFYRICTDTRPDRYMLKAMVASLAPQDASKLLDINNCFEEIFAILLRQGDYKRVYISDDSVDVFLGSVLGCAARSKDKGWPYFDLLANSRHSITFFGPQTKEHYFKQCPADLKFWVAEGVSYAREHYKHICEYAIAQLGLYSATLSTIGCSTYVVNRVVRNGGFGGNKSRLTPGILADLVDCLKWTSVKNNRSIVEHNFGALFSLYTKFDVGEAFNNWAATYNREYRRGDGRHPPPGDYYTYVFRAAMDRAAPFELKIARPELTWFPNPYYTDYRDLTTIFKYLMLAGPVKGVRIDIDTMPTFTTYAMSTMADQYKGGNVLSEELLDTIWCFTGLAGRLDRYSFDETVKEACDAINNHQEISLNSLAELPQFRMLMSDWTAD